PGIPPSARPVGGPYPFDAIRRTDRPATDDRRPSATPAPGPAAPAAPPIAPVAPKTAPADRDPSALPPGGIPCDPADRDGPGLHAPADWDTVDVNPDPTDTTDHAADADAPTDADRTWWATVADQSPRDDADDVADADDRMAGLAFDGPRDFPDDDPW